MFNAFRKKYDRTTPDVQDRIPPGQYRYAFRVDDKEWKVPEGAAASDDDFGGKSAWLVVATPGSTTRP